MKKSIILFGFFVVFPVGMLFMDLKSDTADQINKMESSGSFAVVELFTSEGCSSCPPADKLLGKIVKNAREYNRPVYALAFHVDYWNYLGWKDIFSEPSYSRRQQWYADLLDSHVYTPQMVINGKYEFVGSNGNKASSLINRELRAGSTSYSFTLRTNTGVSSVTVGYHFKRLPAEAELQLALVERGLTQRIQRGENRGRTLHHENVVRAFESVMLKEKEGRSELKVPKEVDLDEASVIAYLQDTDTGRILAACRSDI